MDSQKHKPHRPSQSGAKAEKKKGKGKEKQKGNNEKVSGIATFFSLANPNVFRQRHLHHNQAVALNSRDGAGPNSTRHGSMFL